MQKLKTKLKAYNNYNYEPLFTEVTKQIICSINTNVHEINGMKMLNAFHKTAVVNSKRKVIFTFKCMLLCKTNFITFLAFALLSISFNLLPFIDRKTNSVGDTSLGNIGNINENSSLYF